MRPTPILDHDLAENNQDPVWNVVHWWESNRLRYNLSLLALEILIMGYYWRGTMAFGEVESVYQTLAYNLVANVFYTTGWVLEIFICYYLPSWKPGFYFRRGLFGLGIAFSFWLTYVMYSESLAYY